MNITFILPGSSRIPMGGYKVVFEYANALSVRGHVVTIVHPAHLNESASWTEKRYHDARYLLWGALRDYGPQRWFKLRPEVRTTWVHSLREANIPPGDAIVATGWPTAEYVATYGPDKGRKFYLIQSHEKWWGPEERVNATFKLPLEKIVIARWLQELVEAEGRRSTYIPNGLDFEAFGCDVPIEERREPHVLMLSHTMTEKRSADGIEALELAHRSYPTLKATVFGVTSRPSGLPRWIRYEKNPPQTKLRALYNQATIFVSPSAIEGWPLPPAEAMMCGAALVCTDIGGHREYACDGHNAMLVPPRSPERLAEAILRLINDDGLRCRLSGNALSDIRRFTWTAATDRLESVLTNPYGP